jgi:hypothetical protein
LVLFSVVLDEFADVGLDAVDLGEDLVRGRGPGDKWFGVAVLPELKVPRRMDWRVMIPNQGSI